MYHRPTVQSHSPTKYDPAVIQEFADKLYRLANLIILMWAFVGLAVGAGAGFFLGDQSTRTPGAVVGAIVLGILGYTIGNSRAFLLQFQAQLALCQRQIEENTRA